MPAAAEDAHAKIPDGATIRQVVLVKHDVFDTSDDREDNALYRLVNTLHIITKDNTIRKQLLLEPGDDYSARLAEESARILRSASYLYDAQVEAIDNKDGTVDLQVTTKDFWTLKPGLTVSRAGGTNKIGVDLEELNLLGYGQSIRFGRDEDVDRTSEAFEINDPHIGNSRVRGSLEISDNSDGNLHEGSLIRPFYALDSRWSLGATGLDNDSRTAFYSLGEEQAEYRQEQQLFTLFGGWSKGLQNGWVRRYRAGLVYDDNIFSEVEDGSLAPLIPEDRRLFYPFASVEILQDKFETTTNKEQIGRTEDFFMGQRFTATLGYASQDLDADRNALLFASDYSRGFGELSSRALLMTASASGRIEDGESRNTLLRLHSRYYDKQSDKLTFSATLEVVRGHSLDLDTVVDLGGDTGLRGYPLRYQTGDSKLLITLEQRYFTDWYPFRLFRIGGAIFADVGRVWGDNPVGEDRQRWLRDVGFGLRFASTRTGFRKMVHLDIAFPLDGDSTIDDVQIILESKRSF
jgi:outer membrane protein assembly factor BamA